VFWIVWCFEHQIRQADRILLKKFFLSRKAVIFASLLKSNRSQAKNYSLVAQLVTRPTGVIRAGSGGSEGEQIKIP
jgi:hypothetical protein